MLKAKKLGGAASPPPSARRLHPWGMRGLGPGWKGGTQAGEDARARYLGLEGNRRWRIRCWARGPAALRGAERGWVSVGGLPETPGEPKPTRNSGWWMLLGKIRVAEKHRQERGA